MKLIVICNYEVFVKRFNLLQLFLKTNHDDHRRKLIVDLQPPRFDSGAILSQDPATSYARSSTDLNDDQRHAILKILFAKDYALILGMPGTRIVYWFHL